jgi:hypothetical protein
MAGKIGCGHAGVNPRISAPIRAGISCILAQAIGNPLNAMKWTGTDYHHYDEAGVQAVLHAYGFLTAPIRPSPPVLAEFRGRFTAAAGKPILIFGATPELIDMANELHVPRVVSMDWNVDTFEAMRRRAGTDWSRVEFRHGNWTVPAKGFEAEFGCVACDGGPLFLRFPDEWRAISRAAYDYLQPGGTWVSRGTDWPEADPSFAACVQKHIDEFLAQRRGLDAEAGLAAFRTMTVLIRVRSFHRVVGEHYLIDQAELARRNDEAARILFERFPEPRCREITEMNLLRLARPTPDKSELVSIVPPGPAARILEETGFRVRLAEFKTAVPGCDYVLAATKP